MAKSLREYRQQIRALRAAGFDFRASDGYKLRGPLSSGRKSAITRAVARLEDRRAFERAEREVSRPRVRDEPMPDADERVPADDDAALGLAFDEAFELGTDVMEYEYMYDHLDEFIDQYEDYAIDDDSTGGKGKGR